MSNIVLGDDSISKNRLSKKTMKAGGHCFICMKLFHKIDFSIDGFPYMKFSSCTCEKSNALLTREKRMLTKTILRTAILKVEGDLTLERTE